MSCPVHSPRMIATTMPMESTTVTLRPASASSIMSRYGATSSGFEPERLAMSGSRTPSITYNISEATAAGRAIHRLTRNLSRMRHPWVRVAAMVVSEINERLSPKKAPPSTTATKNGTLPLSDCASSTAKGVRATTVPTDVPMARDMKHAAAKSPGISISTGRKRRARCTVASMAPISRARAAKAPARMNIHTIYITLELPASRENISTRSDSGLPCIITTAHADPSNRATAIGIL
ncbi:hypothetical protein IMSAG192_00123 [Muribaculaceae bacterium]|nr:hypothetical protein IMSAG192_00123 [Muribaculaceae bacterium]